MSDDTPVAKALSKTSDGWRDHARFCRECLTIRDKKGIEGPLILQPAQIKLNKVIADCEERGVPARILYLKARQVMVSTATAAEFFRRVPFLPGQRAMIVAHELKAAHNLFGYYKQFHDGYQKFDGIINLPAVDKDANAAGILAYANKSKFEITSANNLKSGRGSSIRFLHLSEYAFWRDAKTLMTGLMQTMPDDVNTIAVIESTANGVGNDFHRRWQEASDPNSGSEWIAVFFAWWEHPEYVRTVNDRAAFQGSLSRDERELQVKYRLTLEQLHWRRWAIKNRCGSSIDSFKQEFPASPEEAFLMSGRPRFDGRSLGRMPVSEPLVGELFREDVGVKKPILFLPNEDAKGAISIWKKPSPGKRYVIGIDVAEGIDLGDGIVGAEDPDYTVAIVLDGDTGEQVAKLRGRIEPGPAAEYVATLGEWYNWAFLVPEINSVGIAFLEGLLNNNYPVALIYHRHPDPSEQFKDNASTSLQILGWKTNVTTRQQLVSKLDLAIRNYAVLLTCKHTVYEHTTFVIKSTGKAEGMDGCHDDEVIATGLAVVGIETQPLDRRLVGVKPPPEAATVQTYGKRRQEGRGRLVRPF